MCVCVHEYAVSLVVNVSFIILNYNSKGVAYLNIRVYSHDFNTSLNLHVITSSFTGFLTFSPQLILSFKLRQFFFYLQTLITLVLSRPVLLSPCFVNSGEVSVSMRKPNETDFNSNTIHIL